MDADNIIMIIVWGVFISAYVISSIRKNKQGNQQPLKTTEKQHRPKQRPKTYHQAMQQIRQGNSERAKAVADRQCAPAPAPKRPAKAACAPAITALPAEGQRVTASRPMQPVQHAASPQLAQTRATLRDKEALKRAIILGQILEPKF